MTEPRVLGVSEYDGVNVHVRGNINLKVVESSIILEGVWVSILPMVLSCIPSTRSASLGVT
jgi:hypothetical protein